MVDNYKLSALVDVICGGAPLGEELVTALKRRFPHIKHVRQGRVCTFKTLQSESGSVFFYPLPLFLITNQTDFTASLADAPDTFHLPLYIT